MDEASAHDEHEEHAEATPIFQVYRRGYDPEQVDRYVADQQRRLDEATKRASEAERKLAAAVGQLRELHRRVAVLESEERSPQPPTLDALGERIQRILQEAWEGAYALRQSTEQEMAELRERTAGEAEAVVMAARQRARAIEDEVERRRRIYLERVEEDRSRALAQITFLHKKRDAAIGDLLKVKAAIESTVDEMSRSRERDAELAAHLAHGSSAGASAGASAGTPAGSSAGGQGLGPGALPGTGSPGGTRADDWPETLPAPGSSTGRERDASELVRSHRAARSRGDQPGAPPARDTVPARGTAAKTPPGDLDPTRAVAAAGPRRGSRAFFDIEAEPDD